MFFSLLFVIFAAAVVIYFLKMGPRSLDTLIEEILDNNSNRPKPFVKIFPDLSSQISNQNLVKTDNTPLYLKRGWKRTENEYYGWYRTKYGAWQGKIKRRGDIFSVRIYDPPMEKIRNHSRWPCFHQENGKWWRIHLAVNPIDGDVSSVILHVESVINESYRKS